MIGTNENTLRIQDWIALIAMLMLKWLHHLSKARWSHSNLAAMLRMKLFTYGVLVTWLDHPFQYPPAVPELATGTYPAGIWTPGRSDRTWGLNSETRPHARTRLITIEKNRTPPIVLDCRIFKTNYLSESR